MVHWQQIFKGPVQYKEGTTLIIDFGLSPNRTAKCLIFLCYVQGGVTFISVGRTMVIVLD